MSTRQTNHEKFTIEATVQYKGAEQLKELQADARKLPNFGGRGVCASGLITRDFFAILKDRKTGEVWTYIGTRESFNVWGQEVAVTDAAAEAQIIRVSCWICGTNPVRDPRVTLKRVNPKGDIGVWECQRCAEGPVERKEAGPTVQ